MTDNRFIPGVTDQGPPRAAKGGFPYPGHGTLEDARLKAEADAYFNDSKNWRGGKIGGYLTPRKVG